MDQNTFQRADGRPVTAVTAAEMRDIDRIAVEEIGLTLTRMMEHAGRSLAAEALELWERDSGSVADDRSVVIIAGSGGNGGGGLVCARHLANREIPTTVAFDRPPAEISGVPSEQLEILRHLDSVSVRAGPPDQSTPSLVIDALLGYGLDGDPRTNAAQLIDWTDAVGAPVLSLDVPSGVDATTGETPGTAVSPDRTLTLALPKTGLAGTPGELRLADLSIPAAVYDQLDVPYTQPFGSEFRVSLETCQ